MPGRAQAPSRGEFGAFSKESRIEYTRKWEGERFDDGRPRVSDEIVERMGAVTITQAWGVLRGEGYNFQCEDGWQCTQPGRTLVGRAVTAQYMPRRPDLRELFEEQGAGAGHVGDQISWPIDTLVEGDVYVADIYGKIEEGPVIGDNLGTAIYANSGNGIVHDGAIRDLEGLEEMADFVCYVRGWHPSFASPTIMLMGINVPTRVGAATVMPGDIVLGKPEGVVFIPPHLAEKVVKTSEVIRLRDAFGKEALAEGRYTPGQIDTRWTDDIETDFSRWLEDHVDELPVPRHAIREYLKERTW